MRRTGRKGLQRTTKRRIHMGKKRGWRPLKSSLLNTFFFFFNRNSQVQKAVENIVARKWASYPKDVTWIFFCKLPSMSLPQDKRPRKSWESLDAGKLSSLSVFVVMTLLMGATTTTIVSSPLEAGEGKKHHHLEMKKGKQMLPPSHHPLPATPPHHP